MLFAIERRDAGRLYFADLLGASIGALLVTFLLSWLGGENAVLLVALGPILAAGAFSRRLRIASGPALSRWRGGPAVDEPRPKRPAARDEPSPRRQNARQRYCQAQLAGKAVQPAVQSVVASNAPR